MRNAQNLHGAAQGTAGRMVEGVAVSIPHAQYLLKEAPDSVLRTVGGNDASLRVAQSPRKVGCWRCARPTVGGSVVSLRIARS